MLLVKKISEPLDTNGFLFLFFSPFSPNMYSQCLMMITNALCCIVLDA